MCERNSCHHSTMTSQKGNKSEYFYFILCLEHIVDVTKNLSFADISIPHHFIYCSNFTDICPFDKNFVVFSSENFLNGFWRKKIGNCVFIKVRIIWFLIRHGKWLSNFLTSCNNQICLFVGFIYLPMFL